jgi:drug/metabolite transporter (DMT)-like permease
MFFFKRLPNALKLIIFPIVFALGIFLNKGLLTILSIKLLSGLRMCTSGLILVFLNPSTYKKKTVSRLLNDWKAFAFITIMTNLIPTLLKAYGLKHMTLAKASFLGSIDPFITALYAYLIFDEKLSTNKIGGIILGFAGTGLLLYTSTQSEGSIPWLSMISYPEIAALSSIATGRLGWMIVQKKIRESGYSPVEITGPVMTIAGILSLLMAWNSGEFSGLYHLENPKILLSLCTTIFFGNLFAYNLFAHLLKDNSATLISVAGTAIPILGSILGWFFYAEELTPIIIIAGIAITLGTLIFSVGSTTKQAST